MRRKTPTKIRIMKIRIDQRSATKEDAEKCIVCKGTAWISEGLIGGYACDYCKGTGQRRLHDIELPLNFLVSEVKMKSIENLSLWEHNKTKNTYRVITTANASASRSGWVVTVVYEDASGNVWARALTEWLEKYRRI